MRFSNVLIKGLFIAIILILAACSNTQKKEKETTPEPVLGEDGQPVPEVFVAIPNPYVAGDAPGPAKQEFAKIKSLMNAKKWTQAKGLLELMVETYPSLSGPYVNLGIVHYKLKEYEASEKALKFAIETNAQNFDAYTRLGLLYRELGRFDEAEQVYVKALALWSHHPASVKNLGILYDLYMGRFDEALEYYELSQKISGGEDRQMKGWILDLKRRMASK